ncbi:hypothetical protein KFE25_010916 [Diacronema lutheri]|uniref:Peptidase M41 domain-containing protein n=2 Tax=Diacronema lutheri TaxID=2081491 RepID=A0A8J5X425_DIALT|nr:hypothetical protein KFE25_009793 [Diacronema lutheri]KAG8460861.1 hypothetical protein KFE25_010916 [Diacronema lutheri]
MPRFTLVACAVLASRPAIVPGATPYARTRVLAAASLRRAAPRMLGVRERRRQLEARFGREADGSHTPRSDVEWLALYTGAQRSGLICGFGTVNPVAAPRRLAVDELERQIGLPTSALRPSNCTKQVVSRWALGPERSALVSQWALGCQWVLLALTAYAAVSCVLRDGAGMPAHAAHSWGILLLVVEHALLRSALTRAAVSRLNHGYERKLASHEAGHMLAAFLLGLPVTGYQLLCPSGMPKTVFVHPRLGGEERAPGGRVADDTLARLSVVLMAGIAAEALDFGRAEGGASDDAMLRATAARVRPEWRRAQTAQLALWSGCEAVHLLREHRTAHARLADAMCRRAPLGACLAIIADALAPAASCGGELARAADGAAEPAFAPAVASAVAGVARPGADDGHSMPQVRT